MRWLAAARIAAQPPTLMSPSLLHETAISAAHVGALCPLASPPTDPETLVRYSGQPIPGMIWVIVILEQRISSGAWIMGHGI